MKILVYLDNPSEEAISGSNQTKKQQETKNINIFDNEPNRPVIDTLISKRDIKRYFQYQTKAVSFKV